MRKYQKSHSWITFEADLRRLQPATWIALGEAKSKCLHISKVPLKPATAARLHSTYLAKGVHGTTAIEGNTLTEEEVRARIEGKLTLPQSREYQGREVDNILESYNLVTEQLLRKGPDNLSIDEIKTFNSIILKSLIVEEHVVPGQIRETSVGVFGYRGAPAEDCEYLLNKMCEWLNRPEFVPEQNQIAFGIIRAILAHLYIAWIHPFGDGNGRTARLIELKIMLASGAPMPACHLLSSHYNKTRTEYYRQLDYASKSNGDIVPFIEYAINGLVDELESQLEFIFGQQLQVFWSDFVYEAFGADPGKIGRRRRQLALDISQTTDPVTTEQARTISPKVAEYYAGKVDRTIERDLRELVEMQLVVELDRTYLANIPLLLKFIPDTRRDS